MADIVLMLSGTHTMVCGIWGGLIGFNEAPLVLDEFLSFTAFSFTRAKPFTLFGLFVFQSTLHPHGTIFFTMPNIPTQSICTVTYLE